MPERERQICERLREVRRSTGVSQVAAARQLEVDSSLLGNYEYGRAPLRYAFADRVCTRFNLSQRWLASGEPPRGPYIVVATEVSSEIGETELFSAAYERVLKAYLEEQFARLERLIGRDAVMAGEIAPAALYGVQLLRRPFGRVAAFATFARNLISVETQLLPEPLLTQYLAALGAATEAFHRRHKDQIVALKQKRLAQPECDWKAGAGQGSKKKGLSKFSEVIKQSTAKGALPALLGRLREATKERGRKTELAVWLGVPLASLSQWLAGDREPGGEYTLRLLHWVEQAERQQQGPASVSPPAGPKSQTTKSSSEKPHTGPPDD